MDINNRELSDWDDWGSEDDAPWWFGPCFSPAHRAPWRKRYPSTSRACGRSCPTNNRSPIGLI
jgi:hypothetical protein